MTVMMMVKLCNQHEKSPSPDFRQAANGLVNRKVIRQPGVPS